MHGSATPDDQRVPLIFFGPGIKAGRYGDQASPADLAPTLAAALGVSMTGVEGRALAAALAK
jgi:arylsulfatase A-like enzyme